MTAADVAAVERLTDEAFYDHDLRVHRPGTPEPAHRSPSGAELWRTRAHHLLRHDGPGCLVAEDDTGLVGAAMSLRRDLTWILAAFVVRRGRQGRGVGRQLLAAASDHGRGCLRGLLSASEDQAALRSYRSAGFSLHPMMALDGPVPRASLPVLDRTREGSAGDVELMDSVDRRVRDAAPGVDHEVLTACYRLVVVDRAAGSGYAYVEDGGGPHLLAATNRRTATELLWETLAASEPDRSCTVRHLTAVNDWAVDVGMAARMALRTSGYLGVRHQSPPAPYLHSGSLL